MRQIRLNVRNWDFGIVATSHSGWPKTSVVLDTSDPSSPSVSFTERNRMNNSYFATLDMRVRYTTPVRVGNGVLAAADAGHWRTLAVLNLIRKQKK